MFVIIFILKGYSKCYYIYYCYFILYFYVKDFIGSLKMIVYFRRAFYITELTIIFYVHRYMFNM
jgi:hypothetical protein